MAPDNGDWQYLPATSAMTTHLRLLAEVAEEALASHASLVGGLDRSIREAALYGPLVEQSKAGEHGPPAEIAAPARRRRKAPGVILTALSAWADRIALT